MGKPPEPGAAPPPVHGSVLFIHNLYRTPGGEEAGIDVLESALQEAGWSAGRYQADSRIFQGAGALERLLLALQVPYSWRVDRELSAVLASRRPALVHAHNIFPFLSPSVYMAAARRGTPIVQTLHNYRLVCANGLLLRDGRVCERCLGGNLWPAVGGKCYQGRRGASALMAFTLWLHQRLGTWHDRVSAFVALSEFSKRKLIQGGLPAHKIHVIPNFVDVAGHPAAGTTEDRWLYLGRLSREKGLETLLKAYEAASHRAPVPPLHIAGSGPLEGMVRDFRVNHPALRVEYHGQVAGPEKWRLLAASSALIFPSECYENCPYAVLESLAVGTPVIGARLGGTQELLEGGRHGILFSAGDPADLARVLSEKAGHRETASMRQEARKTAEKKYGKTVVLPRILDLYSSVMAGAQGRAARFAPV